MSKYIEAEVMDETMLPGGTEEVREHENEYQEAVLLDDEEEDEITQYVIADNAELIPVDPAKTEFVSVPAVPREHCPLIAAMVDQLTRVDTTTEFETPASLATGGDGYLIADRWYDKFRRFIASENLEQHPGPIDNSDLFEDDTLQLKASLPRTSRYRILSEDAWNLMITWFGGGPVVKRMINERGEVVPDFVLKVVCSNNTNEFRRVMLPGKMNLRDAKRTLCELFEVDESKARLYDYFNNLPHAALDQPETLIQDSRLVIDNPVLIELPRKDGKYVIDLSKRRYRADWANDREDKVLGNIPPVAGAVGLKNIGNTCYLNSTVQCLSNVPLLRDYFVSGEYKEEINTENRLGTQGDVANAFGNVMDLLWNKSGDIVVPSGFKHVMSKVKNQQFAGHAQHDSQEFLSVLLDCIHEDVNRVIVKPSTNAVVANGRPDEEVAAETMQVYKMRNDSKIVDIFAGQFKSTVRCPDSTCGNVSVTFDPYMVLPLPLKGAEAKFQRLGGIFVAEDNWSSIRKFNVVVPKHGPFYLFRHAISVEMGVDLSSVLVTLVKRSKIMHLFTDHDEIADISSSDTIVAYQLKDAENAVYSSVEAMDLDSDWRRPLSFESLEKEEEYSYSDDDSDYNFTPLQDLDDIVENKDGQEKSQEKEKIGDSNSSHLGEAPLGFTGCPFVVGDVWTGQYHYTDSSQVARIEVSKVEQVDVGKFKVDVVFDTKTEVIPERERWFTQTAFTATGVYTVKAPAPVQKEVSKKSKGRKGTGGVNKKVSSFFRRDKKGDVAAGTPAVKQEEKEEETFDQDALMDGNIEFQPVDDPHFYQGSSPNSYSENEEERAPLAFGGRIDEDHQRFWGTVSIDNFPRGQFFMYRYKSRIWDTKKKKKAKKTKELTTETAVPVTRMNSSVPGSEYYFVSMAHRMRSQANYGAHEVDIWKYVPTMFIVQGREKTEEWFYKELMKQFLTLSGKKSSKKEEREAFEEELRETFDVIRSARNFDTRGRRTRFKSLNVGEFLGADSDDKLVVGDDDEVMGMVFLTIHWREEPPFAAKIDSAHLDVEVTSETMNINYALQAFGTEETLSGLNTWYCNKCKVHQEAHKKMELWSLPPVLVVQFKRFSQDEGRNRSDKLETQVDFPTKDFDLSKYVLSKESKANSKYDLLAVSCHYGALGLGHYTAFARNEIDAAWYRFNDSRVAKIEGDELESIADPSAYVIFYIRQDLKPESWKAADANAAKTEAKSAVA